MAGQALRRLATLVIIVAAPGCDNVEWGGAEVHLQPPPPVERPASDTSSVAEPDTTPLPPLPTEPVLFMGTRAGGRVTLRPIAEIHGDDLLPLTSEADAPGFLEHFRARRLGSGAEFTLFAGGARVGTLVADTSSVVSDACGPRATVSGLAELVLPAAGATRFLALTRGDAEGADHGGFLADDPGQDDAAAALAFASQVIMREEALWPDNLGQARAALHRLPLTGFDGPAVAATFLFRDRLAVEPAPSPTVAYSLFVLGATGPEGRTLVWDWYREVENEGKGAARYFESADWDGDGENEILLELFGDQARWVVALNLAGDTWERVYEETCAPSAVADGSDG